MVCWCFPLTRFQDVRDSGEPQLDLRMKNILCCLEAMKNPINLAAAKEFCSLSPTKLVERWVHDVSKINKICDLHQENSQEMVEAARASLPSPHENAARSSPQQARKFFRKSIGADSESLLLIPEQIPSVVLQRIRAIQSLLFAKSFRATHLEVLSCVSPLCAHIYDSLLQLAVPPVRRYELAKRNEFPANAIYRQTDSAVSDALFRDLVRLQNLRTSRGCALDDYNWISPNPSLFCDAVEAASKVDNVVSSLMSDPSFTSDHPLNAKAFPADSLGSALASLDYESILQSRHRQNLLNLVMDCAPGTLREVRFLHSIELDSARLLKIVKIQAPILTSLDLTGCTMLRSASSMVAIADACKKLRYLNISRNIVSALGKTRLVGTRVPCSFSSTLDVVVAEDMPRLVSISSCPSDP